MQLRRFQLPPVSSVLVVGTRAAIGARALEKAVAEIMPGVFERIDIEHPLVEAVLIRTTHLRTVPREQLLPLILEQVEPMMDVGDTVHIELGVTVHVKQEVDVR